MTTEIKLARNKIHKLEINGVTYYSMRVRYNPDVADPGPFNSYTCEHLPPTMFNGSALDRAVEILINDPGAAFDNSQLKLCQACKDEYDRYIESKAPKN
jgi:hypothetical protein